MITKSLANKLLSILQEKKLEMLSFLEELVLIETPSTSAISQDAAFDFVSEPFIELGYYTSRVKGSKTGGYLYARPQEKCRECKKQLIVGHIDTVWPFGTIDHMPFKIEQNKIHGPGVFDMKVGITQIIYALKILKSCSIQPEVFPLVLINSDEEIGSTDSSPMIKRLSKLCSRAFVLEPPLGIDGRLKSSRKGIARFTMTIQGKSSHAGLNPETGVSAIVELSNQIQILHSFNDLAKGISVNVGMIEGGVSANMVAPQSKAEIDVRVSNVEDAKSISAKILNLTPTQQGCSIDIKGGFGRPPMEFNERNKALWESAREMGSLLDLNLKHGAAGGASDGNTTSLYTATLDGLGTPGDGAHALHEFAFESEIIKRTALLALLLLTPATNIYSLKN